MKFKMNEKSLFAVLLRASPWISLFIAVGVIVAAKVFLSEKIWTIGAACGVPFLIIAVIAAWKQRFRLSNSKLEKVQTRIASLNWNEFASEVEGALKRDSFEIEALKNVAGADYIARRRGRTHLVCARRWKAVNIGLESMQDLRKAMDKLEADEATFVALGQVSEKAVAYAKEQRISLLAGAGVAQWIGRSASSHNSDGQKIS